MIGIDLGTTNSCVAVMEGKVSKVPYSVQLVLPTIFVEENLVLVVQTIRMNAVDCQGD